MKKLFFILATASLALNSIAGIDDDTKRKKDPDKYCAEFRDGVLKVIHNGEPLTEDVTLANGTKIHTDATIEKKDGSVTVMKDGQCVDLAGNSDDTNMGDQPGTENKGMQKSDENNPDINRSGEKKSDEMNKSDKSGDYKSGDMNKDNQDMNKSDKDKTKMKKSDKSKSDKTRTKKERKSDVDDDNDAPLMDRPDHNR